MANQLHRFSSESVEYGTPVKWIEAARAVMGGIDLDPASSVEFNQVVKAETIMTINDNALRRGVVWSGRVWLNPPYRRKQKGETKPIHAQFIDRLIEQYEQGHTTQAMLLVNMENGSKWFKPLWPYAMCFAYERIAFDVFFEEWRVAQKQPTHNNVLVYLPPQSSTDYNKFARDRHLRHFQGVFSTLGECIPPRNMRHWPL
jgi:hypothetical protein